MGLLGYEPFKNVIKDIGDNLRCKLKKPPNLWNKMNSFLIYLCIFDV